jgi:hypothetical protein
MSAQWPNAFLLVNQRLLYAPYFLFALTLPLLVLGIGADHAHDTVAMNHLALVTQFTN